MATVETKRPAPAAGTAPAARPAAATSRRKFFNDFFSLVGFGLFNLIWLAAGGCFAKFFFPNVLFEPPPRFKAGRPEEFPVGTVDARYKLSNNVFIVHADYGFYVLWGTCTHLGCKPNWEETNNKFKCPCHGSGFRRDGTNFEGPAPRPLDRVAISLAEDGQLLVDTSIQYLGQPGMDSDELYPQSILRI